MVAHSDDESGSRRASRAHRKDETWRRQSAEGADADRPEVVVAGRLEPELRAVIKRHVVHVDAHNRYLEKRQMWRQHEKEEKEKLEKRRLGTHGLFAHEDSHRLGEGQACGGSGEEDKSSSRRDRVGLRTFDVHAADRILTAREKERKRMKQILSGGGDPWRPDKFYEDELKTEQPWVNPHDVLARSSLVMPPSEGELTPKADSTSRSASPASSSDAGRSKDARKDRKRKKKSKKQRKKLKKKLKKLKSKKGVVC
ncbi:hypothetical protein CSUI_004180 [Cystoisospora suis]|uniref:Uncharacterized protein n=1 Tax=Cystoisospora suis TaxID=483139 RepID=A0A2C6KCS1_9APIC|nr:hypothetical protein CSUI_004180 [Cystoisospora suis]